ncbi:type II toxin-antitoxin system VapC family toxin [Methanothrix harundinacea]|jgi:hypothetical protein|uniref:Putative nucleic acid-binding protein, contains PIN domain n=1 Tax=Methanothrix harundinacea (strain 6Ac) TaxID=1110509 RepID=G7WKQ3_METH6|nr:PIN domain-containing protein [Methanothrix harundinacea]AET63532.1 putative nucleic acid-binding protein, contains PIN domain [Methanothrix harundinacea 6Ac]
MYLVDSNVWLELLLEQERAEEVAQFLQIVGTDELWITEFTIYSIGIIMTRLNKDEIFEDFLSDVLEDSGVKRVCLSIGDLKQVIQVARKFRLDFDDAYQYVAAEKNDLCLVSFDADFDRAEMGRRTPSEILAL